MDSDRFLRLAESAQTPEQKSLFLQQHVRAKTREWLDRCFNCKLGQSGCKKVGFSGKTPAFCSFVTQLPMNDQDKGLLGGFLQDIGYGLVDVGFVPLVSCEPGQGMLDQGVHEFRQACGQNFQWQVSLASSRVFVLLGSNAASHLLQEERRIQDIRGTWSETKTSTGLKQFWFITDHPGLLRGNPVWADLMRDDFKKLSSLLHYAWAVQMSEMYPGSDFQHNLSYEEICDVVANDIRAALRDIPPGRRDDEFMRIMLRVMRDQTGFAARAFWDNDMARKCGVEMTGPDDKFWLTKRIEGGENNG